MSATTNNPTLHESTPDSYDAHLIPAETAARKDREGDVYKRIPENTEGLDSIDTTGGYTVDKEGLVNNYASEPEMYAETPGDLFASCNSSTMTNTYTIIDIFATLPEAERMVSEMKSAGLGADKIAIIGQNYQSPDAGIGVLNWPHIYQSGGLAIALVELGITSSEATNYEAEIKAGKFVVLLVGSEANIIQAHNLLHNIGHRINQVVTP
ncbi:hypothetical protein RIF25_01250 [Thermosynechococcaceae cyanobacterium BACA0444]|uniref:Uncharacterized protein n=1 Tax=Pseudocalidococcus azoricus BACA0444 TaxID=2918990 RepID=A0AAE4JVT9_9CYAN|nr:hypothetical protein [Pseudocalidococcus azoricus]MDS3859423.1 hypothetical protein [Pseudocalidococcus azoricus BACA0444]